MGTDTESALSAKPTGNLMSAARRRDAFQFDWATSGARSATPIQKDPRYAPAYAGLANSYGPMLQGGYIRVLEGLPKMAAAAAKALELDPDLAEAHTAMAATRFNEWNFPGAERESKVSIALNPNDPLPHAWYGYYLGAAGRTREALIEAQRAVQLDPVNVGYAINVANALIFLGRNQEALAYLNRVLELDPRSKTAHGSMAAI